MVKNRLLKRIVVVGLMIALQIILSRFLAITTPLLKISFDFLPMALVGMLYGPVYSGLAWALSDFAGAMLFPIGPYFFGFTLSAFLNGFILGLFLYKNQGNVPRTVAAVLLSSIVVTLGLDTLWLHTLYGNPVGTVLVQRLIKLAVMVPLELFVLLFLGRRFAPFIIKNSAVAEKKAALRRTASVYYNGVFRTERDAFSAALKGRLAALEAYRQARVFFCFVGRAEEVDTLPMIEMALADGKIVAAPRCEEKKVMTARVITDVQELVPGRFGILEPGENCPVLAAEAVDFAVIPAMMCDLRGNRVGYGGGYYDRFLHGQPGILKVALCPEEMLQKRLPRYPKDARMDIVVTENEVFGNER